MDVSKFYHGDYYLEEEVKTMRGKGIASRKKSSILDDPVLLKFMAVGYHFPSAML